jgi:uncharacterized membrane protein YeaQ/YmgE (transglycosylase-associated protein family)
MGIIVTIIIGFVVGLLARMIMPGSNQAGFIVTTLIGIAGAFVGTYVGQALGWYLPGEPAGFLGALVGALLILLIVRLIRRA